MRVESKVTFRLYAKHYSKLRMERVVKFLKIERKG